MVGIRRFYKGELDKYAEIWAAFAKREAEINYSITCRSLEQTASFLILSLSPSLSLSLPLSLSLSRTPHPNTMLQGNSSMTT